MAQYATLLHFPTVSNRKDMGTLRCNDAIQQLLHTSIVNSHQRINLGVVHATFWQRSEEPVGGLRSFFQSGGSFVGLISGIGFAAAGRQTGAIA